MARNIGDPVVLIVLSPSGNLTFRRFAGLNLGARLSQCINRIADLPLSLPRYPAGILGLDCNGVYYRICKKCEAHPAVVPVWGMRQSGVEEGGRSAVTGGALPMVGGRGV